MISRALMLAVIAAGLAGCADYPKDPESTLERVKTERIFHVGLVLGAGQSAPDPKSRELIARIGGITHASPELIHGETEVLLTRLEEGDLDLVIGRFDKKSPWATRVTLGPPLARERQGKAEILLAPVMRNGENGWISLIEAQVRDVSPSAQ